MGTVRKIKAGLRWQTAGSDGRVQMPSQGWHPHLMKSCLVAIGWLKPSTTNCVSDGETSPAHGQPEAHPAPAPLQSSGGRLSCHQLNPQRPSPASKVAFFSPFYGLSKWPSPLLRGWPLSCQEAGLNRELLIWHPSNLPYMIAPLLPSRKRYCPHHLQPPSTRWASLWDCTATDTELAASLGVSEMPESEWSQMLSKSSGHPNRAAWMKHRNKVY